MWESCIYEVPIVGVRLFLQQVLPSTQGILALRHAHYLTASVD